jgi:hypothetical protein
VALSLLSVLLLVKYFKVNRRILLWSSAFTALLAGLTQTYGLIPFFVFIFIGIFYSIKRLDRQEGATLALVLFITILTYLSTISFWRNLIPHGVTPDYFTLLSFNFHMFKFYLNTWGYYISLFLFFIPTINFYSFKAAVNSQIIVTAGVLTLTLFILAFIYQWPDSRFTYLFFPWLIMVFFSIATIASTLIQRFFMIVFIILISTSFPGSFWGPSLKNVNLNWSKNWFVDYIITSPVDRELVKCNQESLKTNNFFLSADPYVKSSLNLYIQIK